MINDLTTPYQIIRCATFGAAAFILLLALLCFLAPFMLRWLPGGKAEEAPDPQEDEYIWTPQRHAAHRTAPTPRAALEDPEEDYGEHDDDDVVELWRWSAARGRYIWVGIVLAKQVVVEDRADAPVRTDPTDLSVAPEPARYGSSSSAGPVYAPGSYSPPPPLVGIASAWEPRIERPLTSGEAATVRRLHADYDKAQTAEVAARSARSSEREELESSYPATYPNQPLNGEARA